MLAINRWNIHMTSMLTFFLRMPWKGTRCEGGTILVSVNSDSDFFLVLRLQVLFHL